MKSFKIQITEKFSKDFEVVADSFEDAIITIKQKYKNDEIVIDSADYRDTTFESVDFPIEFQTLVNELIEYVYEKGENNLIEIEEDQKSSQNMISKFKRLKELNTHW